MGAAVDGRGGGGGQEGHSHGACVLKLELNHPSKDRQILPGEFHHLTVGAQVCGTANTVQQPKERRRRRGGGGGGVEQG